MKQAVAYLRKSTDMQETSLEQQRKDILVFADANEIKVIRFFEEEACGENVEGRPQFRQMIEFCKTSREPFEYVLVPDISRWGRFHDPTETFYWIHEVKNYRKEVIFVNCEPRRGEAISFKISLWHWGTASQGSGASHKVS